MPAPLETEPPDGAPTPALLRRLRAMRIGLVAVVVVGLVVAHQLGVFETFGEPMRVRDALLELGPWGYLAFVVAYTVLQPFGVPGTVFILAAPLIWPWPVAFGLSLIGTMGASVVGFSFSRFVARDAVARLVPARFRRYDEMLARRGFATVVLLRFIFWMPPLLHVFFGVSRVGFWTHFWGSFVGYLVPLLLVAFFGQALFDAMVAAPLWVWGALAAGAVALVAAGWWVRRDTRRLAAAKT